MWRNLDPWRSCNSQKIKDRQSTGAQKSSQSIISLWQTEWVTVTVTMIKTEGPDDHREWRYGWGGQLVSQMVTWTQPQVVAVNISDKDREINSQTKQLRASLPHCLPGHKAELLHVWSKDQPHQYHLRGLLGMQILRLTSNLLNQNHLWWGPEICSNKLSSWFLLTLKFKKRWRKLVLWTCKCNLMKLMVCLLGLYRRICCLSVQVFFFFFSLATWLWIEITAILKGTFPSSFNLELIVGMIN